MNISNDIVSFDSKDLAGFSDSVITALTLTAGEGRTPEEVLSNAVNAVICASKRSRVNGLLESMRPTAEKLAGLSDEGAQIAVANIDAGV